MKINEDFLNLKDSYLFAKVGEKAGAYKKANPDKRVISLGIGDVTLPLPEVVIKEMEKATDEMSRKETFRGYPDGKGEDFLRSAVSGYYARKGVELGINEIFISDGAKSDIGNILDIFSADNDVVIPDPVYPVYVDSNIMGGRKVQYIDGNEANGFLPMPDESVNADIIYLCSPNNPTGAVYNREQLKRWVDYALKQDAVILFDAAYEAFVQTDDIPTSIYEIEGAKKCAIEFCSLSKTAGFTGVRCGYTVLPDELECGGVVLNKLWWRRQSTKFNGVSYIVQRGAEAVFSEEGLAQCKANIDYYLGNTKTIGATLDKLGIWYTGGVNSPYIWLKCPNNMGSWEFFDFLLEKGNIVGTPGEGFGNNGEGFFRLTAFGNHEDVEEAMARFEKLF